MMRSPDHVPPSLRRQRISNFLSATKPINRDGLSIPTIERNVI